MSKPVEILGVVPVIPAPFDHGERIDEPALRVLVEHAVAIGVRAICLPAYGTEFYKLTDDERLEVVRIAVDQAAGRTQVFAQSNHGSARVAARLARLNVAAGAGQVSIAIPRQFAVPAEELLAYLQTVLDAAEVPCLVQDFNPGGPTVSVDFVAELKKRCSNFRYLKLEEPLMAPKVRGIQHATGGSVGILEGWGGMYMLELTPWGLKGLMPGLALAEILNRVFFSALEGDTDTAVRLYERVLPQIVFSLQSLELFHVCEKRLLQAMGLIKEPRVRTPAYRPDPDTLDYVDKVNGRVLRALEEMRATAG